MVVLKEKEALPSGERSGQSLFSFKKARLYKNIKSCQLVLACPISEEQIEDVKKMSYIYKPSNPLMIIEGDYVILKNGRLYLEYKHVFNYEYILLGDSGYTTTIGFSR